MLISLETFPNYVEHDSDDCEDDLEEPILLGPENFNPDLSADLLGESGSMPMDMLDRARGPMRLTSHDIVM